MVTLPFREASESVLPLGRLSQESPVSSGATGLANACEGSPAKRGAPGGPSRPSTTDSSSKSAGAFRARAKFMRTKSGLIEHLLDHSGQAREQPVALADIGRAVHDRQRFRFQSGQGAQDAL